MKPRHRRETRAASPPPGLVAAMNRRARVAELTLRGWRVERIANEVHADVDTVRNDLKQLERGWREAGLRDFDQLKGIEAAKIDEVERCAWEAFERSLEAAQKRTKRKRITTGGKQPTEVDEATVTDTERVGDPRYLHAALAAIADRRKLFGLDTPTKVAHTGPGENPAVCGIVVYIPSNFRDEKRVDDTRAEDKLLEIECTHVSVPVPAGDGI